MWHPYLLLILSCYGPFANARFTSPPLITKQPAESVVIPTQVPANSSDALKPIFLYCEAEGNPSPTFRWTKNGKPFSWELYPDRMVKISGHGTLFIKKLLEGDAGQYQCFATNRFGTATSNKSFLQNVNDTRIQTHLIPSLKKVPEIVISAEGENATFNCEADGTPQPTITWTYNGAPITETLTNYRYTITNNSITINGLVLSDTGNYGCNATNEFGVVYREAYLNVLNLPPIITQKPDKIISLEQNVVVFECKAFGSPSPQIKWTKDNQILSGDRYNMSQSGFLEISYVTVNDTGAYECHAENRFGNETAVGMLSVKRFTEFTIRPSDEQLKIGDILKLYCDGDADTDLELTIDWLKDGQLFDEQRSLTKIGHRFLAIYEIAGYDAGEYTCVLSTPLDRIKATAMITILNVPDAPIITKVECSEKSAILSWKPQNDNYSPIKFYRIAYMTTLLTRPPTPPSWTNISQNISAAETTYTIDMRPYTEYTFTIQAYNSVGHSVPSVPSQMCISLGDVPYKNPTHVHGTSDQPNTMEISWEPMDQYEHNARNFHYRVSWKNEVTGEAGSKNITDWTRSNFIISDLPGYQKYRINVAAANQYGEANIKPLNVFAYSGEVEITEAPRNFTVTQLTEQGEALFVWTKVSTDGVSWEFGGYKIVLWREKGMDLYRQIRIKGSTDHVRVTNLLPHTKYVASIVAFTQRYRGPTSEYLYFTTLEDRPGPVPFLDIVPLGANALWLTWSQPLEPNGILTGYNIYYNEILGRQLGEQLERKPQILDSNLTSAKLTGLKPNTNYLIKIRATTSVGEGYENRAEVNTLTHGSNPPDAPNFTCELVQNNSALKIQWLPFGERAGSSFYAKFRKYNALNWEITSVEMNEDFILINGLDVDSTYEVHIVAIDGEYETESSQFVVFRFKPEKNEFDIDLIG